MRPIREVYPPDDTSYFFKYDYTPMLKSFGYEIVVQVDQDSYQGDSLVLYKNEARYGFLTFGWGSCSGCDALQACSSYEEVDDLRNELYNSIVWFNSLQETLSHLRNKDWEVLYLSDGLVKNFMREVEEYARTNG